MMGAAISLDGTRSPAQPGRYTERSMAGASTNELMERAGVRSVDELAEEGGVRDCLRWFAAERRWIDQKHLELCRIPAPTFQEDDRAAWMADEFRALGYKVTIDRAGNVIASCPAVSEGPFVALTAHLDTVLAPRKPEDISVAGNGRLEGPGVSDNGSGLAALLATAAAIGKQPDLAELKERLLFVANVGEEGEGNLSGMRYLCRQSGLGEKIRCFLVLDGPSTEHITSKAVSSRRFEVTISGPGGHSWSDFGLGNPVHALSRAISLFAGERAKSRQSGPDEKGERTTFNFGVFDGGASVNAIPVSARAKLDIRSESPSRIEEMAALLTASVEDALAAENSLSPGPKLTARIREIGFRPGGGLPPDAAILQYIRAVDAHLGIRAREDCASTDANIPLSLGLAAVSIGAGGQGGGAHTPDEWYNPAGREIGLKRVLLVLCLLSRGGEAER